MRSTGFGGRWGLSFLALPGSTGALVEERLEGDLSIARGKESATFVVELGQEEVTIGELNLENAGAISAILCLITKLFFLCELRCECHEEGRTKDFDLVALELCVFEVQCAREEGDVAFLALCFLEDLLQLFEHGVLLAGATRLVMTRRRRGGRGGRGGGRGRTR